MTTHVEPEYVGVHGASIITGIPVATFYTWRSRGGGPTAHKPGRRVLYKRTELIAWIEKDKQVPAATQVAQQEPKPWERAAAL